MQRRGGRLSKFKYLQRARQTGGTEKQTECERAHATETFRARYQTILNKSNVENLNLNAVMEKDVNSYKIKELIYKEEEGKLEEIENVQEGSDATAKDPRPERPFDDLFESLISTNGEKQDFDRFAESLISSDEEKQDFTCPRLVNSGCCKSLQ